MSVHTGAAGSPFASSNPRLRPNGPISFTERYHWETRASRGNFHSSPPSMVPYC